jgi:hypothetical protein
MKHTKLIIFTCFVVLILVSFYNSAASAELISLEEIAANPEKFDSQIITVKGEVIGKFIKGNNADTGWINIISDKRNLGVYAPTHKINDIIYFGSYKERGDIVAATGVFYLNCPQHQERGLHLLDLKIVSRGGPTPDLVGGTKKNLVLVLAAVFLLIIILGFFKKRHKWKKKSKP